MDLKTTKQITDLVKQFVGIIAVLVGQEGVRITKKLADEWLVARARKAKAARARARRKKS
ncbi:hypothetical protein ES705_30018 [subsurface metagenome]